MADKILIYGPLMGGYNLAEELHNYQFLKPVSRGKTPGKLYDIGGYPGAVETQEPRCFVFGDVYEFASADTLQMIDAAEGAVGDDPELYRFRRHLVPVTLENGTVEEAWMFFFNSPIDNYPRIPSG